MNTQTNMKRIIALAEVQKSLLKLVPFVQIDNYVKCTPSNKLEIPSSHSHKNINRRGWLALYSIILVVIQGGGGGQL